MRTWADFKQSVIDRLTVDGDRAGTTAYTDKKIRDAVRDLQSYIQALRVGHPETFLPEDLTDDGCVSRGELPIGAMLRDGYYLLTDERCVQRPLDQYDWQNRYDLICGRAEISNGFFIAIGPNNREFMIYPKLTDGSMALIFWDGIKADFADTDTVYFTEEVAEAVALYVKSEITREVDKDLALYRSYRQEYAGGEGMIGMRTRLYIDFKRQSEIETPRRSPQPLANCEGCDDVTDTDTGGDTEAVTVGNDAQTAKCSDLYEQDAGGTATYTVAADTIVLTVPTGGDVDAYKIGANAIALDLAIQTLQLMIDEGTAECVTPDLCAVVLVEGAIGGGNHFECYVVGSDLHGQTGGSAMVGPWSVEHLFIGVQSIDKFDYELASSLEGADGGSRWVNGWHVVELT